MKELRSLLERTLDLLEESEESVWSPLTPKEVADNLKKEIEKLALKNEVDKDALILEFAPTSTIQEIAMSYGWSEEYLKLAERFDQLMSKT